MLTWNIDPVLFTLGPLEIRYYGILFSLGLLFAYLLARKMVTIKKLSLDELDTLMVYLIVGLVIGARLGHVVFYELEFYMQHPELILQVWRGGLASHGGVLGALIAFGIFLWRNKKVKFFDYADIIVVVASFPVGLIRLGNFFNSEIVGRPTEQAWGVVFERVDDIARHPSQLYEFLIGVLLFAIFYPLWLKRHNKVKPGYFFGLFMMGYFGLRFLVEFVKEYPLHENFFNLTTGQLLSIPFFFLGLIVSLKVQKKH